MHGPEFPDGEQFTSIAMPQMAEEDGPRGPDTHSNGDAEQQRSKERENANGKNKVEHAFEYAIGEKTLQLRLDEALLRQCCP